MTGRFVLLALLPLLGACASPKVYGESPQIRLLPTSELPAPVFAQGAYDPRIAPFDTITVDVMGFEELNDRRFVVDGAGRITLPIVGAVAVGGLTGAEATEEIAQRLRGAYVRQPQVSVNFYEISSNYVTVQGSVTMPGNYPVLDGMTLTRAVAAARGFTETSQMRDVVVLRNVNGQEYAALYDMQAIQQANYADPAIYPRDRIIVGESASKRLFQQILQGAPLLVGPIVALLQNN